jgi:hypothetical protein
MPNPLTPTPEEQKRRDEVMRTVLDYTEKNITIKLPDFDKNLSRPGKFAMQNVGLEPNPFGGRIGPYRYQFEGEEDLLHLMVTRPDEEPLTPEEGQEVAAFVLKGVPATMIFFRPSEHSQHFYIGHDLLIDTLQI